MSRKPPPNPPEPVSSSRGHRAMLALEDGVVFEGRSFGRAGETTGEVVFNTALAGYQEVLTDPSYAGQIVTMTYPHIGNYGVNREDVESVRPQVAGFIVREASTRPRPGAPPGELHQYLDENGIVGISEIDTRMLTRHLRTHGAKRGVISTLSEDRDALIGRARGSRSMVGLDLAREVTCDRRYHIEEPIAVALHGAIPEGGHYKVVAYDFGMKRNIGRMLAAAGCDVIVVPATTPAEDIAGPGAGRRVPVQRAGRSRALHLRHRVVAADHGRGRADLRDLPGPPDPGPGLRGQDVQAQVRPSRREPSGQEPAHGPGRGHVAEPRVLRRPRGLRAPAGADPHPHQPQRRHGRGVPPSRPARRLRPVPPGGEPGPARQPLPVRRLRRA